jgi:hypothetical protein
MSDSFGIAAGCSLTLLNEGQTFSPGSFRNSGVLHQMDALSGQIVGSAYLPARVVF